MQKGIIYKGKRIEYILFLVSKEARYCTRVEAVKGFHAIFMRVETMVGKYHRAIKKYITVDRNEEFNLLEMHLVEPIQSTDYANIYYENHVRHTVLYSDEGAISVYDRRSTDLYSNAGQYKNHRPVFRKLSSFGNDVFGRPRRERPRDTKEVKLILSKRALA